MRIIKLLTRAFVALFLVLLFKLVACSNSAPAGPADAPPCDLVSCAAGAAFECCPAAPTPRVMVVSPLGAVTAGGWTPDLGDPTNPAIPGRGCMRATGAGRFALPLQLEHGDRMLALAVTIDGDASSDLEIAAVEFSPDVETVSVLGSLTILNAADGWRSYDIGLIDTVVDGEGWHWVEVATDQPGACVGPFRLTFERPEVP